MWVADIVLQKIRDRPLYRSIDIKKDIQRDLTFIFITSKLSSVKRLLEFNYMIKIMYHLIFCDDMVK